MILTKDGITIELESAADISWHKRCGYVEVRNEAKVSEVKTSDDITPAFVRPELAATPVVTPKKVSEIATPRTVAGGTKKEGVV